MRRSSRVASSSISLWPILAPRKLCANACAALKISAHATRKLANRIQSSKTKRPGVTGAFLPTRRCFSCLYLQAPFSLIASESPECADGEPVEFLFGVIALPQRANAEVAAAVELHTQAKSELGLVVASKGSVNFHVRKAQFA